MCAPLGRHSPRPPIGPETREEFVQLGFVIDQSRCIGCHACTVACKSENGVPVGSFRTWVKYTEQGHFPEVKRSFSVMRCNQCSDAPCVTICPVNALEKRASDGIVDVDPAACIGCKSCMQGCPYDALYINEDTGLAEKCHFCAHRTEQGLAPACAVVCPTEAIIPGDFDDPDSFVSRLKREHSLTARKVEAGTRPNVFYRDVTPANLQPLLTNAAGGSIWTDTQRTPQLEAAEFEALEHKAEARTVYDVAHPPLWGNKITGYLFYKSLAAGVFLAGVFAQLAPFGGKYAHGALTGALAPLLGLAFLTYTTYLLVSDLKRPERFWYILARPNWSSWLVRGTFALIAYGTLLTVWLGLGLFRRDAGAPWLLVLPTLVAAGLSACYTGWLFGQAKGRVLWMRRGLWLHLIVQAGLAGNAVLLLIDPIAGVGNSGAILRTSMLVWLALHFLFVWSAPRCAPRGREEEYARVIDLVHRGPFAERHKRALRLGVVAPIFLLVAATSFASVGLPLGLAAAVAALVGLWIDEDILVRAGQALSIS